MRRLVALAVALAVSAVPVVSSRATSAGDAQPLRGVWVAGDLHVHTIYGHDTCITPLTAWNPDSPSRSARRPCADSYTVGFTPRQRLLEAKERGLDFVALSDHNNVLNQTDPAVLSWLRAHPGFLEIPAYENSQPGHVQMLGARSCYDNNGPVAGSRIRCDELVTDRSGVGETELANALRAAGGVFQINHPSDMNWLSAYGYSVVPDTVEVWNIGPWAYQPPFPASNDNDFSLNWYDGFLRLGYQVGVTGGSDTHWVTTDAVQGVGEPTTWVYVTNRTVQGVLDGLRAHRTFVSALPPTAHGAQLFLESDADHNGTYEGMAGSVTSPTAAFRVRAVGLSAGSALRIVTDEGAAQVLMTSPSYTFRLGSGRVPGARQFVRVELLRPDARGQRAEACDSGVGSRTTMCRDRLAMSALTSPIFLS
ncbi:MAG: CehA/McbA family metallohydrolase [Actinomycetes bacterium]